MADLDFYTRNEDNTRFIVDIFEIEDELSQLILQIENILFTERNQVLGQHEFGINLQDLLFTFNRNDVELKNEILNKIYAYCPLANKYQVDVSVVFQKTSSRDVGYITIFVLQRSVASILI